MSEDYDPPLVHLPGTVLTPEVVLHRTLNKKARIKSLVVVIKWDDDSFDTDHSLQSVSDLAMASRMLDKTVDRIMFLENPGAVFMPRKPDPEAS
jgi:hypothetical protein